MKLATLLVILIVYFAQPAFSQYYKLECEVKNYGVEYNTVKWREVADEYFPRKSGYIWKTKL